MHIKYYLNESDLYTHFDYEQSQSAEAQTKVFRAKLFRLAILLMIGAALLYYGYKTPALFLFTYAVFHWFFAERIFAPRRKALFLNMIRKQNEAFLTSEISLKLEKQYVYSINTNSTSTPFEETQKIVQYKDSHLFIQLKAGQGMIVPLHSVATAAEVKERCMEIAEKFGFAYELVV
jgi:hypothetical protein